MNLDNIGTQLLFTTVPIWVQKKNGKKTSGTAFIYSLKQEDHPNSSIPFLVTNYHVVKNAKVAVIEMVRKKDDQPLKEEKVRAEISGETFERFNDQNLDLAIIPIAPIINQFESNNKPVFFRTIGPEIIPDSETIEKLGAIEEVTFIGYPSGIYDEVNASPLIRKGITSSPIWYNFKGEPVFLIDAGVFPGSSGSPVFIYNQGSYASDRGINIGTRVLFIGILTETYTRQEEKQSVFLGLGKVLKSTKLKELVEKAVNEFNLSK